VRVLGVDGCPDGWLGAVVTTGPTTSVEWVLLPDASALLALAATCAATGVDMPIGLTDGPRRCDLEARARLGSRRASVFPAPVRAVLGAGSYAEACAVSRQVSGRALSLQTWHLLPRIADLDEHLPDGGLPWLSEMHPELSFTAMAGKPLVSKKSSAGRQARVEALTSWIPELRLADVPRPARTEDALDALAVAWSALRWRQGKAEAIPDRWEVDARALPLQIRV
jgi:predicted RNase H-like nuclease